MSTLKERKIAASNSFYQRMWRPSMAWAYLIICIFDFLVAPIASAIFQAMFYSSLPYVAWSPLTLGGGGLYHLAMLTIVGVTSWSRGQEKMKILDVLARRTPTPETPEEEEPK
jgi:hypothetical protein